ncbi:MAG TPA: acetyl-CoA C-acetyltransferase [Coxiellaceae bacterium]|nr:acetyl-CoA C-acetyltransferase [Coxiellaceae bacterium]
MAKPVYVVDGCRTPFLKAHGRPGPFSASDLACQAAQALMNRQSFSPQELDEVIFGCVIPSAYEANIGRVIALRIGCGDTVPGWTVQRNCASGMQSLDSALKDIVLGRADLVLAGGTEAMSRAPLILNEGMVNWLADFNKAKGFKKLPFLLKLKSSFFAPIISLLCGLTDPVVGLNMGQTAEILADKFHISREAMDQFAWESHQRVLKAQQAGYFKDEMVPLFDTHGHVYEQDDGVRADTTLAKLADLKPFFDRFGVVTAGNSSQITDGAACLLLASEEAVKKHHLPLLGKIIDVQWAALSPREMGLGPVYAATPLLKRHRFGLEDIDYWEFNEAFAAQVLACVKSWEDPAFCKQALHVDKPLGKLNLDRLNRDGGAVALGHPIGASGARIVLHLLNVLKRMNAKRGIAAICIGGGQGGAMLVERAV